MQDRPIPLLPRDAVPATARRRAVNWRQEYLHLTVILMMASWLAPWVALTLGWFLDISLDTALVITVAHLLGSLILVRWLVQRRARGGIVSAVLLLATWAAVGVTLLIIPSVTDVYGGGRPIERTDLFYLDRHWTVPAGPIIILWVFFLWWRGYKLSKSYLTLVRASFGMRLGILAFVWVCIAAGPALRHDLLPLVPIFFFFGLLSSGLARADSLNLDRTGRSRALGRGWILSLVGIALVVTLGGYIAALWLTGIDMGQVAAVLAIIIRVLVLLFLFLMSPLLMLMQVLHDFLKSILPDQVRGLTTEPNLTDKAPGSGIDSPWVSTFFQILSNGLLIAVVLCLVFSILVFLWFLIISRAARQETDDEERESLGTGEVVGGMRQSLRDGWRRLAGLLGVLRQFGLGRDLLAALTIRRIYARMEKLASLRGYPRTLSETPYEYRRELVQAFPGYDDAIHRITEAYIAVRYGDVPEDSADLEAVGRAWERLSHSADPAEHPTLNKNG